ncbi:MAG: pyridoxamine 5'-phosphate oxidase family protein [Spirochaetales bacterium]|nr:pyridoxamine 5'-phosphate oxidase family protein [Spirochaetales bacterium]
MRRKEKEISSTFELAAILDTEPVMRIALIDGLVPYIVPLHFAYFDDALFFHSAPEGRKINALRQNPGICFEVGTESSIVTAETACGFGTRYKSIIGYGTAHILLSRADKEHALSLLMNKYASGGLWVFPEDKLEKTCCIRIDIETMTGKQSG